MALKITWFPRSWIQIKTGETIIYVDPSYMKTYFKKYPKKIEFPDNPDDDAGLPDDLEKGDLILFTHGHKDHCKKITVDLIKKANSVIIGPKDCQKEVGSILEITKPGNIFDFKGTVIKTVPAYNTVEGSSTRKVHKQNKCVGYCITVEGKTIYHAGDTDFIPEMNTLGTIDVAFLPIGGTFTMNIQDAARASLAIKPKIVVPIHNLNADPGDFAAELGNSPGIEVKILQIGETLQVE